MSETNKNKDPIEILLIYLTLGCLCFGGPTPHMGQFRYEFVNRRQWLDDNAYAELLALCKFVPSLSSSQLGFSISWLVVLVSGIVGYFFRAPMKT